MGKAAAGHAAAARTIDAWTAELERGGLDAVVINASGCGTTVKDYGFMFRGDSRHAEKARRIAELARDVTELAAELGLPPATRDVDLTVAYHSACSMQHGQKLTAPPKALLTQAGFTVKDVPEGHLCCGSAGTYNILQPELATELRDRKVANIERTGAQLIATGNIGCITQIGGGTALPICHTVELLDWATGGPPPKALPDALTARTRA
jgi:glycolate oxidase iron-sulfur subunit